MSCLHQLFDKNTKKKKVFLCFCDFYCLFKLWIAKVVMCCTNSYKVNHIYYMLHITGAHVLLTGKLEKL